MKAPISVLKATVDINLSVKCCELIGWFLFCQISSLFEDPVTQELYLAYLVLDLLDPAENLPKPVADYCSDFAELARNRISALKLPNNLGAKEPDVTRSY